MKGDGGLWSGPGKWQKNRGREIQVLCGNKRGCQLRASLPFIERSMESDTTQGGEGKGAGGGLSTGGGESVVPSARGKN